MNDYCHYRETQNEKQLRFNSTGDFSSSALCGHGAPIDRLRSTRQRNEVTCPACLDKLRK